MGSYVTNRMTNKISPITEKIFSCHSGSAADTQFVEEQTAYAIAAQWYVHYFWLLIFFFFFLFFPFLLLYLIRNSENHFYFSFYIISFSILYTHNYIHVHTHSAETGMNPSVCAVANIMKHIVYDNKDYLSVCEEEICRLLFKLRYCV